jgi:predicted transcriptional regulator
MKALLKLSDTVTVIFKAPADLVELADAYAAATQTSRSWVVRAALRAMFETMPAPGQRLQDEPAE